MNSNFSVVALISGRGSNLKSLVESAANFRVTHVVSNNPESAGLEFARGQGIATTAIARTECKSLLDQKRAIYAAVEKNRPDLIVLAGFMQIVEAEFVERNYGKIINIHPSLLPKFPGLDTHERVIEAGESEHGCTVHYVDAGVDTGPIIAQGRCDIDPDETPESVAAKVLAIEHQLYPWVVNQIAAGLIGLNEKSHSVRLERAAVADAQTRGFIIR